MRCVHFNVCCQCLPVDHKLHSPESRSGKCKCQKEKGMKPLHCFVNIINKVNFLNEKEWFFSKNFFERIANAMDERIVTDNAEKISSLMKVALV